MPRFFVCFDIVLTMLSTSSFSLTNPGESADHSLKCSGIGLRPPLSQATAMQPQYPRLSPTSPLLPSHTFARCSIFFAYGFCTSDGSSMMSVSRWTFLAPSAAMTSCRSRSRPLDDSILLSLSSTFFGVIPSLSARTMDESFTSFSAMMPYIMSPMKRATGLWKWGEILPKKDSSCLSSFAAIVVSYMVLPLLVLV